MAIEECFPCLKWYNTFLHVTVNTLLHVSLSNAKYVCIAFQGLIWWQFIHSCYLPYFSCRYLYLFILLIFTVCWYYYENYGWNVVICLLIKMYKCCYSSCEDSFTYSLYRLYFKASDILIIASMNYSDMNSAKNDKLC